jgi:hypothetical protein
VKLIVSLSGAVFRLAFAAGSEDASSAWADATPGASSSRSATARPAIAAREVRGLWMVLLPAA